MCSSCGGVLGETAISQLESAPAAATESVPMAQPVVPIPSDSTTSEDSSVSKLAQPAPTVPETSTPAAAEHAQPAAVVDPAAVAPLDGGPSPADEARQLLERWAASSTPDTTQRPPQSVTGPTSSIQSSSVNPPPEFLSQSPASTGANDALPVPMPTLPAAAPRPPAAPAQSSGDELDRLTSEILARVSRMTDSATDTGSGDADDALKERPRTGSRLSESGDDAPVPAWRVDSGHARSSTRHTERNDAGTFTDEPDSDIADEPQPDLDQLVRDSLPARRAVPAQPDSSRPRSGFGRLGQFLAYLGILGLVAGASLATIGFLRGPIEYARTGWLVSAVGQMLLFLGIVELISSGMQQTSNELRDDMQSQFRMLSDRIDALHHDLAQRESTRRRNPGSSRARTPVQSERSSNVRR